VWDGSLDHVLLSEGVRHQQACHVRYPTFEAAESGRRRALRAGPERRSGLWRQMRNVEFEPVVRPDQVDAAIARACLLVKRAIPLVINTHRINYTGALGPEGAAHGRRRLGDLLSAVLATREDVHFPGSAEFQLPSAARIRHTAPATAGGRPLPTDVAWSTLGRQSAVRH
jgi:hypothetical protein